MKYILVRRFFVFLILILPAQSVTQVLQLSVGKVTFFIAGEQTKKAAQEITMIKGCYINKSTVLFEKSCVGTKISIILQAIK